MFVLEKENKAVPCSLKCTSKESHQVSQLVFMEKKKCQNFTELTQSKQVAHKSYYLWDHQLINFFHPENAKITFLI